MVSVLVGITDDIHACIVVVIDGVCIDTSGEIRILEIDREDDRLATLPIDCLLEKERTQKKQAESSFA